MLHEMNLPFCCHAEMESVYANKTVVKTRRFSEVPSEHPILPSSAVAAIKRAQVKLQNIRLFFYAAASVFKNLRMRRRMM